MVTRRRRHASPSSLNQPPNEGTAYALSFSSPDRRAPPLPSQGGEERLFAPSLDGEEALFGSPLIEEISPDALQVPLPFFPSSPEQEGHLYPLEGAPDSGWLYPEGQVHAAGPPPPLQDQAPLFWPFAGQEGASWPRLEEEEEKEDEEVSEEDERHDPLVFHFADRQRETVPRLPKRHAASLLHINRCGPLFYDKDGFALLNDTYAAKMAAQPLRALFEAPKQAIDVDKVKTWALQHARLKLYEEASARIFEQNQDLPARQRELTELESALEEMTLAELPLDTLDQLDWSLLADQEDEQVLPLQYKYTLLQARQPQHVAAWSAEEDGHLVQLVEADASHDWQAIATRLATGRSAMRVFQRYQQLMQKEVAPLPWAEEEDARLKALVDQLGLHQWVALSVYLPGRSPQDCYVRWQTIHAEKRRVHTIDDQTCLQHLLFFDQWACCKPLFDEAAAERQPLEEATGVFQKGNRIQPYRRRAEINSNWAEITRCLDPTISLRSLRERWPALSAEVHRKTKFSREEDALLLQLAERHSKRWTLVQKEMPHMRSPAQLRNRYVTLMKNKS